MACTAVVLRFEAGGATSQLAHSHGCWQKALLPCHGTLGWWCPHDMVANFPRKSHQKERDRGRVSAFFDLASEGTHRDFLYFFLFVRMSSLYLAHTLPLKEGDYQRICRLYFQIVIRDCWFIVHNCPPLFPTTVAWVCLCLRFLGPAPWLHGC